MAGPEIGLGGGRRIAEIAGQLDEVGEHAAAGAGSILLHRMALVAADVKLLPARPAKGEPGSQRQPV